MGYYKIINFGLVIVGLGLLWELLLWFIHTKIFAKIVSLSKYLVSLIGKLLGFTAGRYQDHIDMMNAYRREKSIVYKYHYTMNVAIESLGLRTKTNVQTMTFYILVVSIAITSIITIGINSIIAIILFCTLVVFLHLLLVFLSRSMTIKRSIALMDAEDILCTSMEDGIQVAVDKNINAIDPLVRYMFEELQTDIALKTPMGTAMDSLNTKAGKQFDVFCQTALNHYKDNDPVSLNTFSANIQRNSKRRIAIAQQQINYSECLKYYIMGLITAVVFTITMAGILGSGSTYFLTIHGRTCTIISICTALVGFVASQIIFSGGVD